MHGRKITDYFTVPVKIDNYLEKSLEKKLENSIKCLNITNKNRKKRLKIRQNIEIKNGDETESDHEFDCLNDDKILWCDKYHPTNVKNWLSNSGDIDLFQNWLINWDDNHLNNDDADDYNECDSKKAFFIFGSNGNGKTSGVYAIAKQHGYKVVEVSASHVKLTSKLLQQFNESLHSHVITNSRNDCTKIGFNKSLILFDDFDAIIYDKNFQDIIRMIKILIEQSRKPIVIISRFNPEIFMFDDNGGRLSLEILELKPPPIMAVINRLIFILQFEFNNYTLANDLRYFLQNNAYELKDLRKILINTYFWFYHNRPYYKNIWNNIFSFEFSYLLKNNYQYHYHHHIALNSMDNDSNKEDNLVRLAEYLNESARINEKLSLDNIYQTSIDCKLNNEFYSDVNVPFSMLIIQDEPQKELEISLECKFCHSNLDENLDIKSTMNDAEKMLHFYILSQNIAKNDYFEYLSFFAQILCHPSSTNHSKSLRGLYKILLSTNRPRTRSRY